VALLLARTEEGCHGDLTSNRGRLLKTPGTLLSNRVGESVRTVKGREIYHRLDGENSKDRRGKTRLGLLLHKVKWIGPYERYAPRSGMNGFPENQGEKGPFYELQIGRGGLGTGIQKYR